MKALFVMQACIPHTPGMGYPQAVQLVKNELDLFGVGRANFKAAYNTDKNRKRQFGVVFEANVMDAGIQRLVALGSITTASSTLVDDLISKGARLEAWLPNLEAWRSK